MRHLQAEKYNVAWFKLAECVSRGEKERALGVYRLLHHSLDSDALASQLYGDLLLCFDEKEAALEKYVAAVDLYKKSHKITEAIAVVEHLVYLEPARKEYIFLLFDLHVSVDMAFKMIEHAKCLLEARYVDLAISLTEKLVVLVKAHEIADLRKNIVLVLLQSEGGDKEKNSEQLMRAIDVMIQVDNELLLQQFLSEVKAIDDDYYTEACLYLEDK